LFILKRLSSDVATSYSTRKMKFGRQLRLRLARSQKKKKLKSLQREVSSSILLCHENPIVKLVRNPTTADTFIVFEQHALFTICNLYFRFLANRERGRAWLCNQFSRARLTHHIFFNDVSIKQISTIKRYIRIF